MRDGTTNRIERFLTGHPLFDQSITDHGFTPYLRDYDVIVDRIGSVPEVLRRTDHYSYVVARYRYRFTHCVSAIFETRLSDEIWRVSWEDHFIGMEEWRRAGEPEGFIFGVCWADAYPGGHLVQDSELARDWSQRLAQPMHEAVIETNTYALRLTFHDLRVTRIAVGDAATGAVTELAAEEHVEPTDDL
jgi:hypothetical protein